MQPKPKTTHLKTDLSAWTNYYQNFEKRNRKTYTPGEISTNSETKKKSQQRPKPYNPGTVSQFRAVVKKESFTNNKLSTDTSAKKANHLNWNIYDRSLSITNPYFNNLITNFNKKTSPPELTLSPVPKNKLPPNLKSDLEITDTLPSDLKSELNEIKSSIINDKSLTNIINGNGASYNRLIIFFKKLHTFMHQKSYYPVQIQQMESAINNLLTNENINLKKEIGTDLNHLEEEYLNGNWTPSLEDSEFFKNDLTNKTNQEQTGEFHPKWLKETEIIPGIPTSQATLAYWNFRQSKNNTKVTGTLIQEKDPALYHWLNTFKTLKRASESTSSPLALSRHQIAAISQRLDYADEIANKALGQDSDLMSYHWDQTNNKAYKPKKQRIFRQPVKPKEQNKTHTPASEKASHRKRRSTSSLGHPTYVNTSKIKKTNSLERTEIPKLNEIIKTVLEKEEQRLSTNPASANHKIRAIRAQTISALDELSRLYAACHYHFESPKSSFIADEDDSDITFKSNSAHLTGKEKKTKRQRPVRSIIKQSLTAEKTHKLTCFTSKNEPTISTVTYIDRDQELSEARKALEIFIEKANNLLDDSASQSIPTENWQSLAVVIKLPLVNLRSALEFKNTKHSEKIIREMTLDLIKEMRKNLKKYIYKFAVWSPEDATQALTKNLHSIKAIKIYLLNMHNEALKNEQEPNETLRHLQEIQIKLRLTEIVNIRLTEFCNHLKSSRHDELYRPLAIALNEWALRSKGE